MEELDKTQVGKLLEAYKELKLKYNLLLEEKSVKSNPLRLKHPSED